MTSVARKQYKRMMRSAAEYGTESTVARPGGGEMCQAYVVPRHEVLYNPAFAELRQWEGLEEPGTTGVGDPMYLFMRISCMNVISTVLNIQVVNDFYIFFSSGV